ncbi:MAG: hypothetical protein JW889_15575 [Verrucomicrobia bacterium]|nr:hypothetical protein [Verrucomicrobiota bacterium]
MIPDDPVGNAAPRADDDKVIAVVRAEFTRAIGPMAHVVLDELLASFTPGGGQVPPQKWPELIEKLGWEIHSDRRRVAFQKQALSRLQELRQEDHP